MATTTHKLTTPLTTEALAKLKPGDKVILSGVVYTGRDAAHERMMKLLDKGEKLPFDVKGAAIFYVGPSPTKPGNVIGSAGPTTSYRMDKYSPRLLDRTTISAYSFSCTRNSHEKGVQSAAAGSP
jgi:fumarate hydratase subunit beta